MSWHPNLIVPGVAKCGTTTLHNILLAHPRIAGGDDREIRFLMDKADAFAPPISLANTNLDAWVERYPDRGHGDFDYWLDVSPQYQYQQCALPAVAGLDPAPKVIVIARRPSRRLYSMYQYARYQQKVLPHVASFSQFIEEIRPPISAEMAEFRMMGRAWEDTHYNRLVEAWREILPAGHLFVMTLEELAACRDMVLIELARWLGIEPEGLLDAPVDTANATVGTRSILVRQAGARLAKALPENAFVRTAKTFVRRLNSAKLDRSELEENEALLAQLDADFAPSMRAFQALKDDLRAEAKRSASSR